MNYREAPVLEPEGEERKIEGADISPEADAAIQDLPHEDGYMSIKDYINLKLKERIEESREGNVVQLTNAEKDEIDKETFTAKADDSKWVGLDTAFSNREEDKPRGKPTPKPTLKKRSAVTVDEEVEVVAPAEEAAPVPNNRYIYENVPQERIIERIGRAYQHAREQIKAKGKSDYPIERLKDLFEIFQIRARIDTETPGGIKKVEKEKVTGRDNKAFEIADEDVDLIIELNKKYRDGIPQ